MGYRGGDHVESLMVSETRRSELTRLRQKGRPKSFRMLFVGLLAVVAVVVGYMWIRTGGLGANGDLIVIVGGVVLFGTLLTIALR
jgi:hypothetical protein